MLQAGDSSVGKIQCIRILTGPGGIHIGKNQEDSGSSNPTPDFQVEAEEDIKSETSGTLQELLLALAKVRRAGLLGRKVTPPGEGVGQNGKH